MSFSLASIRPRLADWRGWLPLAALPLFMFIALLALGGDRGYLYRAEGEHDWGTVKNLAIAENLSIEHNFLLTTRVWRDEDGGFRYAPYGRFPVGGYVLLKLALSPFGGDLAAKGKDSLDLSRQPRWVSPEGVLSDGVLSGGELQERYARGTLRTSRRGFLGQPLSD